ncbi:ATP-binding cassette domain-containing protein [Pseudomonas aeruginosa]|nr:ATP-binding cassette domain-containing protein [Pseudomonas aeruginosa]MBF3229311.1 ATP-binding cassette domain-containing protein [Pseudomonas aeruginosa]MBF3269639.1 ATP-binding cassette domain-containing protein [Pseudomonas aeruginosa]MBF3342645.1 ATP-binding cassette domain-containing protein [Pseudomonas aeruginosa]
MTSAIAIERICMEFGTPGQGLKALDDVSLDIHANEFFTLLGPSGCGKTTLLRLIAGFEQPSSGSIRLYGEHMEGLPPFRRPVNTVFQSYALFPHMSVADNIGFGLEMQGRPRSEIDATVSRMLDLVKLPEVGKRRADQLSGGQQQRIALARALASRPKVLLLDESLSALDLKLRKEMQIELKRLQHETGITFIFVTHDQEEALTMSDRIAVMSKGKVLQVGTPSDIYEAPLNRAVADFIGETNFLEGQADADGVRLAREIVGMLPWNAQLPTRPARSWREPLYPVEELLGVVPADPKKPYDVREIVARIADGSEFLDFKNEFDGQTVCGHLRIEGHACGLIGNNGPITPQGAAKAAQFIQLCEQSNTPLLFLHNTTGFMVGTESERQGVIKHGSKMIQAVANARVPKLTLVVGGSYGAGNYAMCGRGLDPRFIFAWPNSRTAVMGGAQAGKVLRIVTEEKHAKEGKEADPKMLEMLETVTAQKLDSQSTALYGTASLWDDGLVDPRDSRRLLGYLLDICAEAEARPLKGNSFGVARF